MGAKAPTPPDPVATAQAQGAVNRDTAITQYLLNATDQVTPFGSLTYEPIGNWANDPRLNPAAGRTQSAPVASASTRGPTTNPGLTPSPGTNTTEMNRIPVEAGGNYRPPGADGTGGGVGSASSYAAGGAGDMGQLSALGQGYLNTPRFRAVQTLAPDLQATVDNYLGTARTLSGTVADTLSRQLDTSGLPSRAQNLVGSDGLQRSISLQDVPLNLSYNGPGVQYDVGPDDFSADRRRVEDALFSRLNPQVDRQRANLEANLRARGLGIGTAAYDRAVDELNRSTVDRENQVILAGGQEQSRLADLELAQGTFRNTAQNQGFQQSYIGDQFTRDGIGINNNSRLTEATFRNQAAGQGFNQDLAAGQFNNSNRSQALEEQAFLRSLPLNEINALLGGTQIAGPKFTNTPTPGVQGVDYAGLVQSNYQAQVNAANQKNSNLFGGLSAIGGGLAKLLPFSDRRLKHDIAPIRATLAGHQLYSYRYIGSDRLTFGVMAQDVAQTRPDAVVERDGFMAVRYDVLEAA